MSPTPNDEKTEDTTDYLSLRTPAVRINSLSGGLPAHDTVDLTSVSSVASPTPQPPPHTAWGERSHSSRHEDSHRVIQAAAIEPVIKQEKDGNKDTAATMKKKNENVPFLKLYAFATWYDVFLLVVATVASVANGACFPLLAVLLGDAIGGFMPYNAHTIEKAALEFLYVAIGLLVTGYLSYYLFQHTAERQISKLRVACLRQLLYREIAFYDSSLAGEVTSRISGDSIKIQEGIGEKLGEAIKFASQFAVGYLIGFIRGWKMSLVMAAIMPAMALSLGFLITKLKQSTLHSQKIYAEAGAVAEETISSMRTVISLNAENQAIEKYGQKILNVENENIHIAKFIAFAFGWFLGSVWVTYSVGLWYGGKLVSNEDSVIKSPSDVFRSFYSILIGTMSLAQMSPNITAVASARGAAVEIFRILVAVSQIDASAITKGIIPEKCIGKIEAIDVCFSYPSRPDVQVLKNYTLTIEANQTVALVGGSGGGKSTLIALIERFYNPSSGNILLDGRDIRDLQLKWLRGQIGLVSQEPILFAKSIYDNIIAGATNPSQMTQEKVVMAAKLANAHSLIMQLPQQYNTMVGERGVALSGGQKQRIALARALIREPRILLLDEATSALDTENERIVQEALNELMRKGNMTTIVIAHRLSTIRHADKIAVISGGEVKEQGKHEELIQIENGIYRSLAELQFSKRKEGTEPVDEAKTSANRVIMHTSDSAVLNIGNTKEKAVDVVVQSKQNPVLRKIRNILAVVGFSGSEDSGLLRRVFSLNRPERAFAIGGIIACSINGFSYPGSALLISEILATMTKQYNYFLSTHQKKYLNDLYNGVQIDALIFLGAAAGLFFVAFAQAYNFRFMSEKLVSRLRKMHFKAILRQNIAFFDEESHSTGALASNLNVHSTKVVLIAGESQGRLLQALFTCVSAFLVSFILGSWLLTLVMLAVFPILIAGSAIRTAALKKGFGAGAEDLAPAGACATEALSNMRTVAAYSLEEDILKRYSELLEEPLRKNKQEAHLNGFAQGFSQFSMFAANALVFWYGGQLVSKNEITFLQLMRTIMTVMMSATGVGQAISFLSDTDTAKKSAKEIFELVDKPIEIDSFSMEGKKIEDVRGKLEFRDIYFSYPTRPYIKVLTGYNLLIEPGQVIAFCGPSGCGKSTIISLLERFYNPEKGEVLLDDHNIASLNIRWLRDQLGFVGQEPILFDMSIGENIMMGLGSARETLSKEEIDNRVKEAARLANAHAFISQFPDGYNTQVGLKGTQLSGGQKQRIAIARAMIKNPKVLLLDEATSALDTESEIIVQKALDSLIQVIRCTTIIIAHRLTTIRNADQICVISDGKVAEKGTHDELLALGGIYETLVAAQTAEKR